jgi:hypothetical protein
MVQTTHRSLGDVQHPGFARYVTICKAMVESAVISWLATLGNAISWTLKATCPAVYTPNTVPVNKDGYCSFV